MKQVIILHGTGSTPESYWHPYLKTQLEKQEYTVHIPALPDPDHPELNKQLSFVLENFSFDRNTILIGHSSGVPLILSILENIENTVHQAILVSGFFEPLNASEPVPILQTKYDWEKIKRNCNEFIFLNSDNDPWGCTDTVGRNMAGKVGGRFILMKGEGHMGSATYKQPYVEFSLLLELVD